MVLAAGLGLRMRPITEALPKPLVEVAGRTLIDRSLDRLLEAGVEKAVVNVHYLGDRLAAHLAHRQRPKILISDERQRLLDTGGGIFKALGDLGSEPFFLLNSDSFWIEGGQPNLAALWQSFDEAKMDALLLLAPAHSAVGYEGKGDFSLDASALLRRRRAEETAPLIYSGAALLHPRLFIGAPEGAFSLNLLFDRAVAAGRLFGLAMEGIWLHVGTPEAIRAAEAALAKSAA